jgi:hypothetical protein
LSGFDTGGYLTMSGEKQEEHEASFRISLNQIVSLEEMPPDMCRKVILLRIQLNLQETKHPFRHKTAGTAIEYSG